jgi:hypothetical protein
MPHPLVSGTWSHFNVQLQRRHDLIPKVQAETQLTTAVRGLLAIAEAYPDLKANQTFLAQSLPPRKTASASPTSTTTPS